MNDEEWGLKIVWLLLNAAIMLITLLCCFCLISCNSQIIFVSASTQGRESVKLELEKVDFEESKAALQIDEPAALLLRSRLGDHA